MRGSQGEWVGGFAKYIGYCNTLVAELWGVLESLKYMPGHNFKKVELHVDSLIVVGAITDRRSGSPNRRVIVEKIHPLLALEK
jgi:ribonuclease HI